MATLNHLLIRAVTALLLSSVAVALNLPDVSPPESNTNLGETRIIGGVPAAPKEFPHQVHLFQLQDGLKMGLCGGSIIGKQWILTAAHCVHTSADTLPPPPSYRRPAENLMVQYGSINYWGTQEKTVEKVIVHPKYGENGLVVHDFALLKVHEKFTFNEYAQLIALAPQGFHPAGNATVSGWGQTNGSNPQQSLVLLKTTLPIIKDVECSEALPSSFVPEAMLCAGGGLASETSGCRGDSGGPLIQEINKKKLLVGVVSWGIPGCPVLAPNIFARVSSAREWIKNETGI